MGQRRSGLVDTRVFGSGGRLMFYKLPKVRRKDPLQQGCICGLRVRQCMCVCSAILSQPGCAKVWCRTDGEPCHSWSLFLCGMADQVSRHTESSGRANHGRIVKRYMHMPINQVETQVKYGVLVTGSHARGPKVRVICDLLSNI